MSNACSYMCVCVCDRCFLKMPLTAAAKQREYRKRRDANPVRRQAYLIKEREAWKRKKETSWKPMAELQPREQRLRRRKNREAVRRFRSRQKNAQAVSPELNGISESPECGTSSCSRLAHMHFTV